MQALGLTSCGRLALTFGQELSVLSLELCVKCSSGVSGASLQLAQTAAGLIDSLRALCTLVLRLGRFLNAMR